MKTKNILFLSVISAGLMTFASCSEESGQSDKPFEVPANVASAFSARYPDATNVKWSSKNGYAVVDFYSATVRSASDTRNNTAWFLLSDATWQMTETEIRFADLPQAVKDAFSQTEYASAPWNVSDEVDVLHRNEVETLYVIDVEKKENNIETEIELFYTEDGVMAKLLVDVDKDDDYFDHLPQTINPTIEAWLKDNFPGARVLEVDVEKGKTEVEIYVDGKKREVSFDASNGWLYTKTELDVRDLNSLEPEVLATLRGLSNYVSDDYIDDIDRYETKNAGTFYKFELETAHDDDFDVYIMADGTLLDKVPSYGGETGVHVDAAIADFVGLKYPGAVIVDKDYDKGYIEVEILHEGLEKELLFNGRKEWIQTSWEVRLGSVDKVVTDAFVKAGFDLKDVDDDEVSVLESQKLGYTVYVFEVEKGDREYIVLVSADGKNVQIEEELD